MSHLDARFQTNEVTVWRLSGRSDRGAALYDFLGVFGATWKTGKGVKRDSQGNEFTPKDVYYIDSAIDIRRGDFIQRGSNSGGEPGGDLVRTADRSDNSFFGWTDSLVVMTA